MQALLSDLARPVANIVHIGAGDGSDMTAYLQAEPRAVLLAEANPEAVARLETLAAEHSGVTVVEAAVSADPEKRPFHHTNFPELDSFRAPTGLTELFPGLRVLSQAPVAPTDPAQLIGRLELDGDGSNLLVLETPGESLGILETLAAAGLLVRFDAIRLREGRVQLYDGAATAGEIRDYLAGLGFAATVESTPEDPERPYLDARLDRALVTLKQEREALATALAEAEAETQKSAERNATLQQEAETLRKQLGEAQTRVEKLEQRQSASLRDLRRAEGQVDLIKDIFLRGEGL